MARIGSFGPPVGGTFAELSRRMFKKLDHDRSGMLSREEFTRSGVMQKLGVAWGLDDANAMFDSADVNDDGKLSPIESQVMFTNLMVHKPELVALISMMTADEAAEEAEGDLSARASEAPVPTPEELQEQADAGEADAADVPAAVVIWREAANPSQAPQPELDLRA